MPVLVRMGLVAVAPPVRFAGVLVETDLSVVGVLAGMVRVLVIVMVVIMPVPVLMGVLVRVAMCSAAVRVLMIVIVRVLVIVLDLVYLDVLAGTASAFVAHDIPPCPVHGRGEIAASINPGLPYVKRAGFRFFPSSVSRLFLAAVYINPIKVLWRNNMDKPRFP
jgi:hypothetical protein